MRKIKWIAPILMVSMIFGMIACKHEPHQHSFGIWEITKEPTETQAGRNERTCKDCGYVDSVVLQSAPEGFRFVKGTTITGTEIWTPESPVFIRGRTLTIPDLIVSDHEVTRGEYEAVMGSDPSTATANDKDGNKLEGDAVLNNPVNYVNWYHAIVYCNTLSLKENLTPCYSINDETDPKEWGDVPTDRDNTWNAATCDFTANGYRLPTSAEREWLARGEEDYTYAGSDNIDEVAWYTENTNETGTREVKTKAPNRYGLYDMSGNVMEWCYDRTGTASTNTIETIGVDTPEYGVPTGDRHACRSGSWAGGEKYSPVYYITNNPEWGRYNYCGFRVVRTLD